MKNKIIMILLSAMLLISISGCDSDSDKASSEQNNILDETNKDLETQVKEDEETKQMVKLYFSDDQGMNLIEVETEIILSKEESLEMKIIETLKSQPEYSEMFNAIDENIKVKSVNVVDKLAIVDLSSENLNGSSTQEIFLVDSIVASLTALDTIESVKFLVDGKEVETLMGHLETTQAFTVENITNNIIKMEK